jgi:hypothetical protein
MKKAQCARHASFRELRKENGLACLRVTVERRIAPVVRRPQS